MQELGCEIIEQSEKMAVVGLLEVISNFKLVASAFLSLVKLARKRKPAAALLLDYPDFNLRFAKKMKRLGIPVIYYISPQVWAWRQSRVHLIKQIVDKMLVVFPFEREFYKNFDVPVTFVGHPLLHEISLHKLNSEQREVAREKIGVQSKNFLVGLLPGSRHSELKYCLQTQLKAAEVIASKKTDARFLILVAPSLELKTVQDLVPSNLKVSVRLVKDDPLKILQLCDSCIVASGTATLMTALSETPMVIMYKMNAVTGFLAKRLVKGPEFFGMVNLILRHQAVPEFFQAAASPENLAAEIIKYADDPVYTKAIKEKLASVKHKLGDGGATIKVVDELMAVINRKRKVRAQIGPTPT